MDKTLHDDPPSQVPIPASVRGSYTRSIHRGREDMSNLAEVDDKTFEKEVLKAGPAAVKFWAEW